MSFVQRQTVTLTTAADGSATAWSESVTGAVSQIRYVKPASGGLDDGSTITITVESTGETIWTESNVNASATRAPRQATHSVAGVASTFDGTRAALDKIAVAQDRIKIVIAAGGNGKNATFHIVLE
jgi:hypothetical protein